MIRRTDVLLLPGDEALIEDALKQAYTRVCSIDQSAWESIESNGRVDGPQVGPVIQ